MMEFYRISLMALVASCSHSSANLSDTGTPHKPATAYGEIFAKDKYACTQNYSMTQPAMPTQQDPLTELLFMTLYVQTCLEGRGWKVRPDNTTVSEWLDKNVPPLYWEGDMAKEPSLQQFTDYAQVCFQQFTEAHPEFKVIKKSDFDVIMEYEVACMKKQGYGTRSASAEKSN